jgi:rare lipoprotein A (peptidoglycan hydrolase)
MTPARVIQAVLVVLALGLLVLGFTARPVRGATRGTASWYDNGPGLYGAVHSFRFGDPTYQVKVTADNGRSVVVTVVDYCECYVGTDAERIIDLSPSAFAALSPTGLGAGLLHVTVQVVGASPRITPPPTDTETPTPEGRRWMVPL